MELEDYSFAVVVASVPAFQTKKSYIGSPKNGPRPTPNVGTPIQELRAREASVRVALEASTPKPPIVPTDLEGRELALAENAAQSYEPSGHEILNVLGHIAKNILAKEDLRVEITEALHSITHRLDVVEDQVATARHETKALNERLLEHAQNRDIDSDRMSKLEAELAQMKVRLSSLSLSHGRKAGDTAHKNDPGFSKIAFFGFPIGLSRDTCIRVMQKFTASKIPRDDRGEPSYSIIDCDVFYKKTPEG